MPIENNIKHSVNSTSLADLLERVLDKGIVIAGDIKVKLVDVELLTIQIRLVICSVDKAREMGMDWWKNSEDFLGKPVEQSIAEPITALNERMARLETLLATSSH